MVTVSIVGVDSVDYGYFLGKRRQEQLLATGLVPWTLLRATQFHEFAGQMFALAKAGPLHIAPRARTQPIAAHDVGVRLAALAAGDPQGRTADIAGPREEALDAMIKAWARANGHRGWIPSVNIPTAQMKGMREGLALPEAGALFADETFDEWLARSSTP